MRRNLGGMIVVFALICLSSPSAMAQLAVGVAGSGPLTVKGLAEKTVQQLPSGPLYWRVENFPTRAEAQAAAGATGLVAEAAGKVWLFTLGPSGGASHGGAMVVEVGPILPVPAPKYMLRINEASGPPGSTSPVHSHPGSEAVYVLAGEETFRTPHGVKRIAAGTAEASHHANTPMQAASSGSVDLHALVMFVVDATRPFSSPATMP
jgi:quercetin dioxygenase-like cupin family protein